MFRRSFFALSLSLFAWFHFRSRCRRGLSTPKKWAQAAVENSLIRQQKGRRQSTIISAQRSPTLIAGSKTTTRPRSRRGSKPRTKSRLTISIKSRIARRSSTACQAFQLSEDRCTDPTRRMVRLLKERRTAKSERLLHPKRPRRHARAAARSRTNSRPTARRGWAHFRGRQMARYILYGISQGGSDWNDLYVLDVATKKPLARSHCSGSRTAADRWLGDDGFFYSRYPEPEKGRELYTKNEYQSVWYHKLGTPQADGRTDLRRQSESAAFSECRRHRRRALRDPLCL